MTSLGAPNLSLGPEHGETLTTGFVYRPTFADWIDGLQLSVDWYEINMTDRVQNYGIQRIVDDCFATGAASACSLISRGPNEADGSPGPITRMLNQYINAAQAQTRGVDFEGLYSFEPNFFGTQSETMSFRALVGYLAESSVTNDAGTVTDSVMSISRPNCFCIYQLQSR